MQVEAAIYSLLSGHAPLTNLVSDRIYPLKLPQNTVYPAVTFYQVSGIHWSAMGRDTGVVERVIQVSAWSRTYTQMQDVATAVRHCLQRYRGTVQGFVIQDIFIEGDGPEIYEDEVEVYQSVTDFNVIYEETL